MESSNFALLHVYIRKANLTTKRRFDIVDLRRFAWMNSQGSRAQKTLYTHRKRANAKNFASKRGLAVKFARLTKSWKRAIVSSWYTRRRNDFNRLFEIMYIIMWLLAECLLSDLSRSWTTLLFSLYVLSAFFFQKTLNCFQSHELLNGQLALNSKRFLGYALSLISQAIELCSNEFAITFFWVRHW